MYHLMNFHTTQGGLETVDHEHDIISWIYPASLKLGYSWKSSIKIDDSTDIVSKEMFAPSFKADTYILNNSMVYWSFFF